MSGSDYWGGGGRRQWVLGHGSGLGLVYLLLATKVFRKARGSGALMQPLQDSAGPQGRTQSKPNLHCIGLGFEAWMQKR